MPCCLLAMVCLTVFGLGRASPVMLGVLLLATVSIGTPAFMALRRRWLAEEDRGRRGWLGILAGLLLLSAMAAALSVSGAILS